MLVLTRKVGEEIVIDSEIRLRVVQCGGGRVRIALDASQHVRIVRSELLDFDSAKDTTDSRPVPKEGAAACEIG
ncbi:MAG: carbon storage regulator [Fuerstiella sp.]